MTGSAGTGSSPASTTWDERQRVPWWWWGVGLAVAITFVVAVWAFLGDVWGLVTLVVAVLLVAAALLSWSRAQVVLTRTELRAGGARLELEWIGECQALDAEATAIALRDGVRDWLALRPWLKRVVRVSVSDPADPHPHWLVSTADPEGLAAALNAARSPQTSAATVGPDPTSSPTHHSRS